MNLAHPIERSKSTPAPAPPDTGRLLLIVNPQARRTSRQTLATVTKELRRRWTVEIAETERPGHAMALAREAAGGAYTAVIAFGGDGTVNELVNGLGDAATSLACLPGGATNVFCRLLGIPANPQLAARQLVGGTLVERTVDVGEINGRRFVANAGIGLDGSVALRAERWRRVPHVLHPWRYLAGGLWTFVSSYTRDPPTIEVEIDGRRFHGVSVFLQNGQHFTYFGGRPIDLTARGSLHDGGLAVATLRRARLADVPGLARRGLRQRSGVSGHRQVDVTAGVREMIVRSLDARALPLCADGDFVGEARSVHVTMERRALRVLVPAIL